LVIGEGTSDCLLAVDWVVAGRAAEVPRALFVGKYYRRILYLRNAIGQAAALGVYHRSAGFGLKRLGIEEHVWNTQ
jgi:hypothetical protein